ncbi:MAG: CaiB/BaiF CoA-transferase family protein [Actinomycetota bacterium]
MAGPLSGYRIIEIAGIGPGPFCAMLFADMGAEVIRVERAQAVRPGASGTIMDVSVRSRKNIAIDLKNPEGVEALLKLVEKADAIIEGFRPGVMERLGVGPDACLARNPKIVFGRMTGWGQDGPYAQAAGHDINYISLAGALAHYGREGQDPTPPLNMVGDFGGGGMFLAYGVVCALLEAQKSGKGQVVDTAMVDGTAILMSMFWGMKQAGVYDEDRPGTNLLDTGAHFYDAYRTKDGKYVSFGSIEPQFYAEMLQKLGLENDPEFARQMDKSAWPNLKKRMREIIAGRTRDEWNAIFEMSDVCYAPVLTMSEAAQHPHNVARNAFLNIDGLTQPAPAPRFSRTVPATPTPGAHPGQNTREVLSAWGIPSGEVDALIDKGAVKQA